MEMRRYDEEQDKAEFREMTRFFVHLGVSTLMYPLEYSRVLMQLGYEPMPPQLGFSLTGKPILLLPNIFQYTSHIRQVDGWIGCYRGLTPKLIGSVISTICSEQIAELVGFRAVDQRDKFLERDPLSYEFKRNLRHDLVVSISSTIIAQPFTVISVRMMAQFVGRETTYDTLFGAIKEIYTNEGFGGFFLGLVPRLIWNTGAVLLTSIALYVINKYMVKDKVARQYASGFMPLICSHLLYPFHLVANCAAVTGSGLQAGKPPIMAEYDNWIDCFTDLSARGALGRGRQPFRRIAGGLNMNAMNHAKPMQLSFKNYISN